MQFCENAEVRELIAELNSWRNDKDALMDCDGIKGRTAKCKKTVLEDNVETFGPSPHQKKSSASTNLMIITDQSF